MSTAVVLEALQLTAVTIRTTSAATANMRNHTSQENGLCGHSSVDVGSMFAEQRADRYQERDYGIPIYTNARPRSSSFGRAPGSSFVHSVTATIGPKSIRKSLRLSSGACRLETVPSRKSASG